MHASRNDGRHAPATTGFQEVGVCGACNFAARLAAIAVVALALSGGAVAEPGYSFDTTPGKLPKTVIPVHYAIELTPDLESLGLAGAEVVDIEVREPTARLTLNAVNMTLGAASIDDDAQRADIALDAATETATLTFPKALAAGAHRLRIGFTARINTFGRGLFFVDYPTDKGVKRMLEPARARRRAADLSVLGRARLQGDLCAHRHGAAHVPRRSATCRSCARSRSGRT